MRIILLLAGALTISVTNAASYYFSSSIGSDVRTKTEAQNPATPYQTLSKLNELFYDLLPGDTIFLKRGDVFTGSIDIVVSGTALQPIVITAYGSGALPVINGFANLTSWTTTGNGIWETYCSSCGPTLNLLIVNGANQPMGRYPNIDAPNKGYLTLEAHSGNSQITDNQLQAIPNWTNAEVVIRKKNWIIDRHLISNHSGTNITYDPNPSTNYEPTNNYGYFIQNHPNTLDQNGEWFYDAAIKKIKLYSNINPASLDIKAAVIDLLLTAYDQSNIKVTNLAFVGANIEAMEIYDAINFEVKNCSISYVGYDGIYAENLSGFILDNCSITDCNNDAVFFANNCNNTIIRNNKIRKTGNIAGAGYSGFSSYQGITVFGDGNLIEYNQLDSTGYSGISFLGSNNVIKNNHVNYFALVKDDAGGIYTHAGELNGNPITGRKIIGNIILNGIASPQGTANLSYTPAEGIYVDDYGRDIEIRGNTVAYCSQGGIFIHNASNIALKENTLYENNRQLFLRHDNIAPNNPIRNLEVKGNIFFSKTISNLTSRIETTKDDITQIGIFDSNFYSRPANQNNIIFTRYFNTSQNTIVNQFYSLDGWKNRFAKDAASQVSPAVAGDSIVFDYNATTTNKKLILNGKFVDVNNNQSSGVYNLAPYTSVILFKKASNCNSSTWIGTNNNLWHNPANWSCNIVPDENTAVTINAATKFICTVNDPATCFSLTINQGAQLVTNGLVLKNQ